MSKNLLAVDDSATMRKVLEITFSGEDFQVSSAPDRAGAMAKLGDNPSVVVIDTSLAGDDGYAIAKEVRSKLPGAVLLLLASRYNPYDAAKGKDAGADDFMDKPFDTQQMIDKIKKVAAAKAAQPATIEPPPATAKPAPMEARPGGTLPGSGQVPLRAPGPTAGPVATKTASFGSPIPAPTGTPRPINAPAPTPTAPTPASGMARVPAPAVAPPSPLHAPAVAAVVDGAMGQKLAGLGLSPAQADAVLALSRELVERVVWEVVPVLAETLIKEEIKRLTQEG